MCDHGDTVVLTVRGARRCDRRDDDSGWNGPGYVLKDRVTGNIVGEDGGEPEDQLLVRDWQWVLS